MEENPKYVLILIGGAGDKYRYYGYGPTHLLREAFTLLAYTYHNTLSEAKVLYCGYNEIKGGKRIHTRLLPQIPGKNIPIYIIGHSLGGWNATHLCRLMVDEGYRVSMLVTLDPVGVGSLVKLCSNIYKRKEIDPKAKSWINISSVPHVKDRADRVADIGGRWFPKDEADVYCETHHSHANVYGMFLTPCIGNKNLWDVLQDDINNNCFSSEVKV